jgi:hypothetical protein
VVEQVAVVNEVEAALGVQESARAAASFSLLAKERRSRSSTSRSSSVRVWIFGVDGREDGCRAADSSCPSRQMVPVVVDLVQQQAVIHHKLRRRWMICASSLNWMIVIAFCILDIS